MNEGYIEVVRLKLEDDRPKGQPQWPSEKKAYNRRVGAAISRGSAERRGQDVGKDDR